MSFIRIMLYSMVFYMLILVIYSNIFNIINCTDYKTLIFKVPYYVMIYDLMIQFGI